MSMIGTHRLVNAVENGDIDSAGLEALLSGAGTDGDRAKSEYTNALLNSVLTGRMFSTSSTADTHLGSPTAFNSLLLNDSVASTVFSNETALSAIVNSQEGMVAIAADNSAVDYLLNTTYGQTKCAASVIACDALATSTYACAKIRDSSTLRTSFNTAVAAKSFSANATTIGTTLLSGNGRLLAKQSNWMDSTSVYWPTTLGAFSTGQRQAIANAMMSWTGTSLVVDDYAYFGSSYMGLYYDMMLIAINNASVVSYAVANANFAAPGAGNTWMQRVLQTTNGKAALFDGTALSDAMGTSATNTKFFTQLWNARTTYVGSAGKYDTSTGKTVITAEGLNDKYIFLGAKTTDASGGATLTVYEDGVSIYSISDSNIYGDTSTDPTAYPGDTGLEKLSPSSTVNLKTTDSNTQTLTLYVLKCF
jgi:hypothetical protein